MAAHTSNIKMEFQIPEELHRMKSSSEDNVNYVVINLSTPATE
jgi:hypothetical protein